MRALIVGARGQDGRILSEQLAERGYEILGLSRTEATSLPGPTRPAVELRDESQVLRLVQEFRPDQIYFLAAHHHNSQDPASQHSANWNSSWEIHVEAFRNVLESVRVAGIPARIFYASSSRVFGNPTTSPQTEATPLQPTCVYGITKATGMMLARHFREAYGIWVSCGILYNHESPLRGAGFLSQKVVRGLAAIKRGSQTQLEIGNLEAPVDWGFAPDYTRAMRLILEAQEPDDFVVATGATHSVRELIEIVAGCLNIEWQKVVVENPSVLRRPALPLCGNASHLKSRTGWRPEQTFEGMIDLMVRAALPLSSHVTSSE
jgi:GDPmannose 4,6-dehydratase